MIRVHLPRSADRDRRPFSQTQRTAKSRRKQANLTTSPVAETYRLACEIAIQDGKHLIPASEIATTAGTIASPANRMAIPQQESQLFEKESSFDRTSAPFERLNPAIPEKSQHRSAHAHSITVANARLLSNTHDGINH